MRPPLEITYRTPQNELRRLKTDEDYQRTINEVCQKWREYQRIQSPLERFSKKSKTELNQLRKYFKTNCTLIGRLFSWSDKNQTLIHKTNLAAIKKAYVLAVEILRDESNAAAAAENLPPGNYLGQGVPNKHTVR
jgi:uncharacterized protein YutE (UPF0331/DUF86 family)